MQELSLNFPTVVILLVILALAVLAIRRMTRRGPVSYTHLTLPTIA